MSTFLAKHNEVERKWYVIDATDKVLGDVASKVASILRGKTKPIYTPHVDTGDYVVIVNADKIRVTGNKANYKVYKHYTGYAGGLREIPYKDVLAKHPERILEHAIKGMLPKNSLGRQMFKKLHVYAGPDHKHGGQNPEALEI
ncbi:50S ribosomal protein L13 [Helcococcus ovis]|uniref:Large ribosomal subunit protein uL13 n=2 Tax=Helcococcus TaxID=31983 RepID=A0A4R9C453_9FIRM|nr:50S ribosomal protein L13 [Helcococcus ovis]TFF66248.1 50S ribosomal protein L13 [Helcococcus ovis]TFF67273.1 50S ribosomal protein L13 [Helcococcus ovis]TFF68325.1 50S ribosomal protein L13 [Helcococcus ovis]WNZ00924.1 50S ribosomal protein L13 [Helcococcus ovis]